MQKVSNRLIYITLIFVLIFCIFQSYVGKIFGFSLYPDEFGYWASAANAVGYDWSKVASLGSFYSYGYSALLIPILFVFKGGITAYRAAIALNFILIAVGFLLLLKIADRRANKDDFSKVLICAIAALYPPYVMYSQMTMAESELVVLFILLCYIFEEYTYKHGYIRLILMVVISIYMYTVHMRSIGVILALVLALILTNVRKEGFLENIFIFAAIIALAGIFLIIIRAVILNNVYTYADAAKININNYSSQGWKIKDILTGRGMIEFIIEFFGKIYYLTIATYGLAVMACIPGVIGLGRIFRSKGNEQYALPVFCLLSLMAEILISTIHMHGSDRGDSLFYGRYDEFMMPVFILLGIYEVYRLVAIDKESTDGRTIASRGFIHIAIYTVSIVVAVLLLTRVFAGYLHAKQYDDIRGVFVSGIGYLNEPDNYDVGHYLWNVAGFACIMIVVVLFILYLSYNVVSGTFLIGLILVAQILLGYRLANQWPHRLNSIVVNSLAAVDIAEDDPDRSLCYLDFEDNKCYIDLIQFNLPSRDIQMLKPEELDTIDLSQSYLIVDWDYEYMEDLMGKYGGCYDAGMMKVFYE